LLRSTSNVKLLAALVAALASVALLAPAAQAEKPEPPYEQFAGCPNEAESPESVICIRSDVTGGHLNVGNKELPIDKPLTLVGGTDAEFEGFTYNSEGGFLPVAQKVPGGVLGLTGLTWLLEFFGSEALTLYATTELAGTPTGFTFNSVTIPIKAHLTNPAGLLGSHCYLGSESEPIVLNLITGTTEPPPPNEPITGQSPEISIDGNAIFHLENGTFVDNSFAAPGVNGCVLKLFGFIPIPINGLIDEISELPSPAGHNESVQDFNIEFTARENVY
jgi:hypothetical protein